MERRSEFGGMITLVVAMVALLLGLHQLGNVVEFRVDWNDPRGWLTTAAPEDAVAAILRMVGLAVGYWVAASTLLYAGISHHASTMPRVGGRLMRLVSGLTLPAVRHIVDRALATALVASIAASPLAPALAAETPQPVIVFNIAEDGIPVPHVDIATPPLDTEQPVPNNPTTSSYRPSPSPPTSAPDAATPPIDRIPPFRLPVLVAGSPTAAASSTDAYRVRRGDNLWQIARQRVHDGNGSPPDLADVDAYWRLLTAANRETLRSGDPNLIYAGEIITLPSLEAAP